MTSDSEKPHVNLKRVTIETERGSINVNENINIAAVQQTEYVPA